MAVFREQPYGNAQFVVEIDGLEQRSFTEVHLPVFSDEAVEYRDGNDPDRASHKMPGRPRIGTLVLRRGFRGNLDLYQWWRSATSGESGGRRSVSVQLLDEGATTVVAAWRLRNAWPVEYSVAPLSAQGGQVLIEQVEVACDRADLE